MPPQCLLEQIHSQTHGGVAEQDVVLGVVAFDPVPGEFLISWWFATLSRVEFRQEFAGQCRVLFAEVFGRVSDGLTGQDAANEVTERYKLRANAGRPERIIQRFNMSGK